MWSFFEVVSISGRGYVTDWYQQLEEQAQQEFDSLLRYLRVLEIKFWIRPYFAPLSGGIFEMRFCAGKVEYRPLGFFGPNRNEYTILIGASKKGKVWTPSEARAQALNRMAIVLSDRGRIREYDF